MRTVTFTVPGRIGGKQRHKSFVHRGRVVNKTPEQTVSQEAIVRHYGQQAMIKDRLPQLRGPLKFNIEVWRNYPKSWSPKRCGITEYITGKPDWDNSAKLLGDALNGICFQDDCQIADGRLVRRYRMDGTEETIITITELSDNVPPVRQHRRLMLGPV